MAATEKRVRLDRLLAEQGIAASRERARALILAGAVLVDDVIQDKAGTLVDPGASIRIRSENNPYVSRGGLKLKGALSAFGIAVGGLVCLDVGASTGGFTDCLLQEGAVRVYALDVGYGQLAWKLRTDPRVVCIERTNIRYFDGRQLNGPVDMATIDTSFISLKLVIPPVLKSLREGGALLALIKPQFEAGREFVGKNGVVRDPGVHRTVIAEIEDFCRARAIEVLGTSESALAGPAGNREYFLYARK
ncbi:MAG: TlyA family RNA methyltransferase [Deltaproteobacteria bacterium]|nr:TlyA family RNA methyltransferase [Deltaproteobacteria bacterium]